MKSPLVIHCFIRFLFIYVYMYLHIFTFFPVFLFLDGKLSVIRWEKKKKKLRNTMDYCATKFMNKVINNKILFIIIFRRNQKFWIIIINYIIFKGKLQHSDRQRQLRTSKGMFLFLILILRWNLFLAGTWQFDDSFTSYTNLTH